MRTSKPSLLGLLTDKDIHSFHVHSKGRMRLSFLLPNESSGCDNNSGAWYETGTMKHGLIIFRAGSIGGCFLFTYRPDGKALGSGWYSREDCPCTLPAASGVPRATTHPARYYTVASSQLQAPQIAPRTKVVLDSRQFSASSSPATPRNRVVLQCRQFSASSSTACSAYYSCTTKSQVLIFQLPSPATPRTPMALQSRQFSSSSSPASPRTKVVLQSQQFSSSSSPDTPRTTVVL